MKSLSVDYIVPFKIRNVDQVRIYLSGNNLLLISKFRLSDPEVNTYGNGLEQGVGSGEYPYARSLTMGIKVEF